MRFIVLLPAVALAACGVATIEPDAAAAVSRHYGTATPEASATLDLGWWSQVGDPQLTRLLTLARNSSPDLKTAAANVLAARATAGQTGADLYPSVTGEVSATVSGGEETSRITSRTGLVDASWEVDLFGRARDATKADTLRARSEEASFAGAYVSLAAEIADGYVRYRACRMVEDVYRDAVTSQIQTLRSTEDLVAAGMSATADRSLARANVASARISLETQKADCTVIAQTIATAAGIPQAEGRAILASGGGLPSARPFKVSSVPADLLRQRPDVVAAELDFSATLLDVDVAKADLYPSLTLGGTVTATDASSWSFGPALSLPIFDGGRRRAAVRSANAEALASAESYRATVFTAVGEVEEALTRLAASEKNLSNAGTLVAEYQDYFDAIDNDWEAGGATLLDREDARRQVQSALITRITQRENLLRQWIALYKAVGGGWSGRTQTTNGA
ncbi:efflux transporter outer membrane subunit [Rhodobacter sp. NSM]|uniref:efflux transporter outer membrane subunit n=1 Tax=Rhodobacter sp. NSM TaxID=3457501 RepID=UPI003FD5347E